MTTEELLLKINGDSKGAQTAVKDVGTSLSSMFGTMAEGVAAGELLASAVEKVLEKLGEIPGELLELAERGSKVGDVEDAFDRLAGGAERAEATLRALQDGTRGTVDDFELMKTANKALSDGMKLSADDFGVMAQGARLLAKQSGGETTEALETLNQAMATGRTRALNLIGVHVNADQALYRYSQTIGKNVDELTNQQKVNATAAEVLRQLKVRVAEAGDQQLTFAERVKAAKTRVENFEDELGKAIARSPVLAGAMDVVDKAIGAAFGKNQQANIETVVQLIASIGLASVRAASFVVEGAREIGTAYETARGAVDAVFKAFNDREIARVQKALDAMREVAATSTSPTSASKLRVQELEIELARLKGASKGYQEDVNAAAASKAKLDGLAASAQSFMKDLASQFSKTGEAVKTASADVKAGAAQIGDSFEPPSKKVQAFLDDIEKLTKEFDAYAANTSVAQASEKFSAAFADASIKAAGLGLTIDQLPQKFRDDADAIASVEFRINTDALTGKIRDGIGNIVEELDKLPGQVGKTWGELAQGWVDADRRMTEQTMYGTQLRLAQIDDAEKKEVEGFANLKTADADMYAARLASTRAFYQYQRDEANGTASTIEARMRAAGIETTAELNRLAADAARDYDQMRKSGEYSAAAIEVAWQRMVEASMKANGGLSLSTGDLFKLMARQATEALSKGGMKGLEQYGIDTAKDFVGTLASAIPVIGPELQKLAGPLMDLVGGLFKKIFSTAGRDAVKEFAKSFGGFDPLHDKLLAVLGDVGEKFWVELTQRIKKGDRAGADALIAQIQTALANAPSAVAAAAGYQTRAELQAVADKAKQVYDYMVASGQYSAAQIADAFKKMSEAQIAAMDDASRAAYDAAIKARDAAQKVLDELDGRIKSLQQSIDQEAPEEVMGIIEAQQRAELEKLRKQREEAQQNLDDANAQIQAAADAAVAAAADAAKKAGKATVDAIRDALEGANFRIKVTVDGLPGSSAPGASTGALVTPRGLEYFRDGGPVSFRPLGTDTIPAMLTPGEIVLNAAQQARVAAAMTASAQTRGGGITFAEGAIVIDRPILKDRDSMRELGGGISRELKDALSGRGLWG
jgi:BMFP domain-containing protein YqiC